MSCNELRLVNSEALECQRRIFFVQTVLRLGSDDMNSFCSRRTSSIKDPEARRILTSDLASDCADPFSYLSKKRAMIHRFSAEADLGDLVAFEEAWNSNLIYGTPEGRTRLTMSDVLLSRLDAWNAGINDTLKAVEREMDSGDESSYSAYSSESESEEEEEDEDEDEDEEDDDDDNDDDDSGEEDEDDESE